jgi:hypothetical protein
MQHLEQERQLLCFVEYSQTGIIGRGELRFMRFSLMPDILPNDMIGRKKCAKKHTKYPKKLVKDLCIIY